MDLDSAQEELELALQAVDQHEEEEKHRVHMVETLKTLGVSDNLLKVMGVLSNDEEGGQIDFDRLFNPE